MEKVKNFTGRMPKDNKKMHHSRIKDQEHLTEIKHKQQHNNMHEKQDRRKISTTVNQFPFTRSLERFKRSERFFVYVVQLNSTSSSGGGADLSPPSPLEWSEVRWKDLVVNWGRNTTFSDLLKMSTPLHNDGKTGSGEGAMQKKLILHCIPKAASTTLRRACYRNQKESCEAIDFPAQQDPFGYRNITDFFRAVKECDEVNHFCIQGGDALMSVINYEGKEGSNETEVEHDDEREPLHFVHMVPFRNFDDWVESAIKQIFAIDGNCDRADKLLDHCYGYRELYYELYPKAVLSLLIGMTFDANGKGISGKDKHHIMMYNYKDVDSVVAEVSDVFGMEPLPRTSRRHKENRVEGTCSNEISEKFHKCHDLTFQSADAIRDLKAERKRRRKNDAAMKGLFKCIKRGDCKK